MLPTPAPEFGPTWEEISDHYVRLLDADRGLQQQMQMVLERFNGDIVVPLPSVKGEPEQVSAIPALVADTIDNLAMRATSVRPQTHAPSIDRTSMRANERAQLRQRAWNAIWWDQGVHDVLARAAYRYWTAYGTATFLAMPDFVNEKVTIEARSPLGVYPDWRRPNDIDPPARVVFTYARSVAYLRRRFPTCRIPHTARPTDVWTTIEYIDDDAIVIGVVGPHEPRNAYEIRNEWPGGGCEVARWRNLAERSTVAMPSRITLDRIAGQVASMLRIVNTLDHMAALDIVKAEKGVFADLVITGRDGEEPKLLSGAWKDGRSGEANIIMDGQVQLLTPPPSPMTDRVMDRLERAARSHAGNPAFSGGEFSSSVRSGATVDAMAGMSIDPRLQEAQQVMARSGFTVINEAAAAVLKGYFPTSKQFFVSGWTSDPEIVEFEPGKIFAEATANIVRYAFPGLDATSLGVGITQLVGARLMSRHSGRVNHPWIEDAELEEEASTREAILDSVLQGFAAQVQSGAIPLIDIARIMELFTLDGDLVGAILKANTEAQERQARMAPPPEEGMAMAPEEAPGLSMPEMGVEAQPTPPTIPPLDPSLGNARELMNALSSRLR